MYLFIFEELKEKNIKLILVESDTFNELIHYKEIKLGLHRNFLKNFVYALHNIMKIIYSIIS